MEILELIKNIDFFNIVNTILNFEVSKWIGTGLFAALFLYLFEKFKEKNKEKDDFIKTVNTYIHILLNNIVFLETICHNIKEVEKFNRNPQREQDKKIVMLGDLSLYKLSILNTTILNNKIFESNLIEDIINDLNKLSQNKLNDDFLDYYDDDLDYLYLMIMHKKTVTVINSKINEIEDFRSNPFDHSYILLTDILQEYTNYNLRYSYCILKLLIEVLNVLNIKNNYKNKSLYLNAKKSYDDFISLSKNQS